MIHFESWSRGDLSNGHEVILLSKYRVTLAANQPLYAFVTVEAESEEQAEQEALAMADTDDVGWIEEPDIVGIDVLSVEEDLESSMENQDGSD